MYDDELRQAEKYYSAILVRARLSHLELQPQGPRPNNLVTSQSFVLALQMMAIPPETVDLTKSEPDKLSSPNKRRKLTKIYTKDAPKFDLDSYISNYEGRTRLDRLRTIGVCSGAIGRDALRAGLLEAKDGKDAAMFRDLLGLLKDVAPTDPLCLELNEQNAVRIEQRVQRETDRLETDLKGFKNQLIKESIRLGNDDLGVHYYRSGNLPEAFKAFNQMREYCTVPKHMAEMALKLVLTAVAQSNWMNAQSQLYKLETLTLKGETKDKIEALIGPLRGLTHMASGAYREAANSFLNSDPIYSTIDAIAGVKPPTEILTANDVAVYGGLCALASLSRAELNRRVLENPDFRSFLELESHLRRAIVCFCNSKYTQCLEILESYRTDYLLDVHLQRHVEPLYAAIRRKSVVAYCAPFSKLSIASMAAAFGVNEQTMEAELESMIRSGDLDARLDLVQRMLVANKEDRRAVVQRRALEMAEQHERTLRLRLFRINMLQAGFEIRPAKNG